MKNPFSKEYDAHDCMAAETAVYNLSVEKVQNYAVERDGVLVYNVKP